jgi:hypothetical protein
MFSVDFDEVCPVRSRNIRFCPRLTEASAGEKDWISRAEAHHAQSQSKLVSMSLSLGVCVFRET